MVASAFAADVQMSVEKPLISLLDRTVLKIEFIDTQGDAVDIPDVDGLNIQYQGQSSETRIVNFKSSSKIVHNYIVTPTKVGDYTIGPVVCTYRGGQKEVSTQLRVIKPQDDKEAQQISEIMFSRIATDREAPYVHEPFDLDLKVYIRDGVQIDGNFSLRGGMPESGMEGELKWEVTGQDRTDRNGTIFNVYTLHTTAKTLTAGTFTFRPEVQVNVVVPRQNRRPYGFDDPFFGDFFGRQETRPIVLDCNTLDVAVQSVPTELRPASYTGGVGVFDFDVDVAPSQLKAGEPITVKMRISGDGNLSQITPPAIAANHDLKLYEARSLPASNPNEVRFEQVVIPKSDSVTEIPAISFSYFNTKTADFRTLTKGPFPVTVEAMPQQAAQVIASIPSTVQQKTEILGRDIVYLKPAPKVWKKTTDIVWYRTKPFHFALALPALFLLAVAGATSKRNALANDVARARRQKAPKAARKNVARAEQALRQNNEAAFYEALWYTLAAYFGHRLNLAPGEVSLPVVLARLPQEAAALESLFNTIEQRRYGFHSNGGKSKDEMKSLLRQLTATLKKCERIKL
ncbi:MAG: BatD family protein [Kiritimatiellales bacterium]|nr:BatD family protein [Kiritimatiellales bacterium]